MTDIVERLLQLAERERPYGSLPDTLEEAAAEISRLRVAIGETLLEREDARAEVERLRAGGCARDQGTTQYCAEAAKLAAENERLRAWNREIAVNAKAFAEALREIADFDTDEDISNEECMRDIARAALEGRT